jgi:proteasome lid subunit RPN8/RPN11
MESPTNSQFATWTAPECPFAIEYSLRVLDDIRLAVLDAYFSLPRGGAEIGGILLGAAEKGRVVIVDYAALECEHAYGPSFTLSDRDYAKLRELLEIAGRSGGGMVPVGWYHSHTRSEVFFSDADIAIHKQFFPEPWQIALVLKPNAFEPARAGFFFREPGGTIHGESSYREFTLEPQLVQPGAPVPAPSPVRAIPARTAPDPAEAAVVPGPASAPIAPIKPPSFLAVEPPPRHRRRWVAAALAVAGIALGGYQTQSMWMPPLAAAVMRFTAKPAPQPKPAAPVATLGLTTADQNGQLHIIWDRNSPVVRSAATGILSISEGPAPLVIPLDLSHLQTGSFTYGRQASRVDVSLTVQSPDGRRTREVATYVGAMPDKPAAPENAAVRKERDNLAKEAARLKSDLKKQAERTTHLERSVDQMRLELIRQQRMRMQNMNPDAPRVPAKK